MHKETTQKKKTKDEKNMALKRYKIKITNFTCKLWKL